MAKKTSSIAFAAAVTALPVGAGPECTKTLEENPDGSMKITKVCSEEEINFNFNIESSGSKPNSNSQDPAFELVNPKVQYGPDGEILQIDAKELRM